MADIYRHQEVKLADAGLQLRLPVDMVPPTQYSRITNWLPVIEGRLAGRSALKWLAQLGGNTFSPSMGVHTLFRLNQASVSTVPERLFGEDVTLLGLSLPDGTTPVNHGSFFDGNPFTRTSTQFPNDPAAWAIFAEHAAMVKYKPNAAGATGYAQRLGIPPPRQAVRFSSAAGGGAITGTDYDWRYTFYNATLGTESNPSPIMWDSGAIETLRPTAVTSPDPGFGGSLFFAANIPNGSTHAVGKTNSAAETRQSILFNTWGSATNAPYQSLQLVFTASIQTGVTPLSGCCFFSIYFSVDGGTTWRSVNDGIFTIPAVGGNIYLDLPANIDLSQLQVRAVVLGVGDVTVPPPITGRRIRQRGGNFDVTGLLTGGGGSYTLDLSLLNLYSYGIAADAAVDTNDLSAESAILCVSPDPTNQATAIRLYRRGGSIPEGWFMVGEFPVASLTAGGCGAGFYEITDNIPDDELGQQLSLLNDAPVTSIYNENRPLPYIWGPFIDRLIACGDPDRPGAVYFSNSGNGEQWGSPNWIQVSPPSDGLQGGCVYNTRCFAFSHERMYELVPGIASGVTFDPFPTPTARGLVSPWGLCVADMIYFVAKDGVYATTGGQEASLVENDIKPLFPTYDSPAQDVNGYEAVDLERIEDIKLEYHNGELWFLYLGKTTGTKQILIYDTIKKRWRAASYPLTFPTQGGLRSVYSESTSDSSMMAGDYNGNIYLFSGIGADTGYQVDPSPYTLTLRTGSFDQGMPLNTKEYGNVIFDVDPGGGTITITPYINGEAMVEMALTITGSGRQQVPLTLSDVIAFNLEFEVSTVCGAGLNPIIYQFDILWRAEPVYLKHFEVRPTSHDLPGFQFIRDMYVALRSTADITLSLVLDETTTQTYTIPSTAGKRVKTYLPIHPNKYKLVQYIFDSSEQFKLYETDSEVRLRDWNVPFSYIVRKPFGADSTLTTSALEGRLVGSQ